jgi:hypothetical protein
MTTGDLVEQARDRAGASAWRWHFVLSVPVSGVFCPVRRTAGVKSGPEGPV